MLTKLAVTAVLLRYVAAQGTPGGEMLRFGCSQLVIERADPIVQPGVNPSAHTHQIVGGNSFNFSMDPAAMDPSKESTCTSCIYAEDKSNYWTATVYFRSPENGTFKLVPQMANFRGFDGKQFLPQEGGLTVYYMPPYGGSPKTTAFKRGFRMIAGDPGVRSASGRYPGICHRCNGNGGGFAPCDSHDTSEFPLKPCPDGIRATVIFPSCWDGKNLDSPDHRSHMAYAPGITANSTSALAGPACPASHPVRVPQVMYEIMLDTRQFNNPAYFEGGKQPFVYSFGDPTGHGQHGDYLFGWEGDALQKAMDNLGINGCTTDVCSSVLTIQDGAKAIACTKKTQVDENVGVKGDWLTAIPGNVPVA